VSAILYEKKGRIVYITLNRPERLNALGNQGREDLNKAWVEVRDDPEVWVAIVTGAGDRAFCAGQDLKETGQQLGRGASEGQRSAPSQAYEPDLFRGLEVWKPFIAAINGIATGLGLELAMSCDLRIAAESARLGLAEVKRALMPTASGTQRLPRLVPLGKALEMLMTGDFVDAQEAYRIGLVNKVVPLAELMPEAEALANRICENGPLAVRAAKEAAYRGLQMPLSEGFNLERILFQRVFQSQDSREGIRAFVEKRAPEYKAL